MTVDCLSFCHCVVVFTVVNGFFFTMCYLLLYACGYVNYLMAEKLQNRNAVYKFLVYKFLVIILIYKKMHYY